MPICWNFENTYLQLPPAFWVRQNPVPVRAPSLAILNMALAETLGLNPEDLNKADAIAWFSGNQVPEGAEPLAQAYAGHQFGHFTMLGDGRAILLGEQITPAGQRFDIQLKGAGQTAFSRRGDGRATLGPMLREYIISEAMAGLGIPTTRSLAVVTTGEPVFRETALPGAILTRVAASHIRVGNFEYASATGNRDELKALADYTARRHYPECFQQENPYEAFLQAVIERQARLIAQWQCVGFIHGVMNTDNMALSGETIDYGPCAFMDHYDPATVFSSIDRQGRYAYGNQPIVAQWNLARFTETVLPLLHAEPEKALALGQERIAAFSDCFQQYWLSGMRAKLGLFNAEVEDAALIEGLLSWMHQRRQDFTNTFYALSSTTLPEASCMQDPAFVQWHGQWQARLSRQSEERSVAFACMKAHNPSVIPRNHQVEAAIQAAVERQDLGPLHGLLAVLETPYADSSAHAAYQLPAPDSESPYQTFCGT